MAYGESVRRPLELLANQSISICDHIFSFATIYKKKNCFDEWPTVSLPRMKLKCVSKMHALEIRDLRNRVERNFHE